MKYVNDHKIENTIIENKQIYNLSTKQETNSGSNKIPLKEKDLLDIELISILANATDKTQKPFISRTLNFINNKKDDKQLTYYYLAPYPNYEETHLSAFEYLF